jgi:hypothetical protein
MRTHSRAAGLVVIPLLLSLGTGCATGVRQQRTDAGTVTVGVTTAGRAASATRVRVTIDPAGISESLSTDAGVFTARDVPAGDHVVRLREVPAECRVDGPAERRVTISPQLRSAAVRFHLVCG